MLKTFTKPVVLTAVASLGLASASGVLAQIIPGDGGGGGGSSAPVGPTGVNPPPSIETSSPGGVDYSSGAYSMQSADLEIGDGSFPGGLAFSRSYNSGAGEAYAAFGQGWSHNWHMRVTGVRWPTPDGLFLCDPVTDPVFQEDLCGQYYHVVTAGGSSAKFSNNANLTLSGSNIPGVYTSLEAHTRNQELRFVGSGPNAHFTGHYEYTTSDGTLYVFHSLDAGAKGQMLSYAIAPNGVRIDVHYDSNRVRGVFTSDGYALIVEYANPSPGVWYIDKACTVNVAVTHVAPGSNCPANARSVTYGYGTVPIEWREGTTNRLVGTANVTRLTESTNALNEVTSYEYDNGGHVDCVKDAGQSQCRISMTYSTCLQDPGAFPNNPNGRTEGLHLSEKVLRQQLATGEMFDYVFGNPSGGLALSMSSSTRICPDASGWLGDGDTTFTDAQGNSSTIEMRSYRPDKITDPLNRVTENNFPIAGHPSVAGAGQLTSTTAPEGNRTELEYDARGNLKLSRAVAKPGSGAPTLTTTASFPSSCSNSTRKTCNQATSATDANGNTTNFEFSNAHGGMTRSRAPAVGGIRPETRYTYDQFYAWTKSSGSSYSRINTPVTLVTSQYSCRTSAMQSNGNCAAGSADKVTTTYEYEQGSSSKGSNLLLLGTAVTADGQTLRTCVTYDDQGRPISQTQPNANLASCQ